MAKCWLTNGLCLNNTNFSDTTVACNEELKKIDPMRKGQYDDYLGDAKKASGDKE